MKRFAVFGHPVKHSRSPLIHQAFARQFGHELVYEAVDIEEGHFEASVRQFFRNGGSGLNITVPYKLEAFELAVECSDRAKRAEAVNTLMINHAGELFGDNTDGIGLVRDLRDNLRWSLEQKRVLVVGAGGAVRGVLAPLLAEKPGEICIVNRTPQKAETLVALFADRAALSASKLEACGYDSLGNQHFDIIINGTSASIAGELPPLPEAVMKAGTCCYDMMYGAQRTAFLQFAAQQGCSKLSDGLGMLVEQAAESYHLWNGVMPQTVPVIEQIRNIMAGE